MYVDIFIILRISAIKYSIISNSKKENETSDLFNFLFTYLF